MSMWRRFIFLALLTVVVGVTGCTSDGDSTTGPGESGPTIEGIGGPFSEQDLAAARHAFDAGKERWESFEPFSYALTVGWQTVSELRIDVAADGTTISETVLKGDPDTSDIQGLPRSVHEVFARVDAMITMFEDDPSLIPDEGECGHHFNASFDTDWGVPSRYDGLGPCDDGVGVYVTITPLENATAVDDESSPVLEADGDEVEASWQRFVDEAQPLDTIDLPSVAGFRPFNDAWQLPDGRYLARGQWEDDEPIARWSQRNPDSVGPDDEVPEPVHTSDTPIRLFVIDGESVSPLSHVPQVREYSTAISIGEGPDTILEVALLADGQTVAYTSGFGGAGYDIPYELYTVSLPAS